MKNSIDDIKDLFSMFHDFEIVSLHLKDDVLTIQALLPWSEMWNIEEYKMTYKLFGCKSFQGTYWEQTSNEKQLLNNVLTYPTTEQTTNDPEKMSAIKIDVQSSSFEEPNHFILHCDGIDFSSRDQIGHVQYAQLEFTANKHQIFDNEMNEISLDKMKSWSSDWWNKIVDSWNEKINQNEKDNFQ